MKPKFIRKVDNFYVVHFDDHVETRTLDGKLVNDSPIIETVLWTDRGEVKHT